MTGLTAPRMFLAIAALTLLADLAVGESFDRPVEEIRTTNEGEYNAGFMHWHARSLFPDPAEFVVLGEVLSVEAPVSVSDVRGEAVDGRLRVDRIVTCPDRLREDAARVRTLASDCFNDLEVGDRVLVFMVRYEGSYAIPRYWGANSTMGFRVPESKKIGFEGEEVFLDLLSSDRAWSLDLLTPDELRLWAEVDPHGVAFALIADREREKMQDD